MSTTIAKAKGRPAGLPDLDRQITQAKTVLRQLRDTLEDLDDRRELARAKARNAGQPGTDWAIVSKELGLQF